MSTCPNCYSAVWQEPGTTCPACGRGILEGREPEPEPETETDAPAAADVVWVIDTDSRSYEWRVIARTRLEALRAFRDMWNDWCDKTGADPYYWGYAGDKWADIEPVPVQLGVGYMDRAPYPCDREK